MQWIFYFSFACNSATIVAGALAERTKLTTYILFSFFQTSFIYPVCFSWNWGKGWLYYYGFYDYAGTTTVHLVGGICALVGSIIVDKRIGFYFPGESKDIVEEEIKTFMESEEYRLLRNELFHEKIIKNVEEFDEYMKLEF